MGYEFTDEIEREIKARLDWMHFPNNSGQSRDQFEVELRDLYAREEREEDIFQYQLRDFIRAQSGSGTALSGVASQ